MTVHQLHPSDTTADVIVVGAGPAGSTVATYLARSGVDVLLLEKSVFPREKVCGDGITPRGVKQVLALGIDVSGPDWMKNKGLRVVGAGRSVELDWPTLQDYPDFGLVRTRRDFDGMLAELAVKAGARLHTGTTVSGPIRDEATGRITGVTATVRDADEVADNAGRSGKGAKREMTFHAPLVIAADGVSARVALGMGIAKRDDRPLGVAVRRYYTSPRTHDDYLESHLELWDRSNARSPKLLPGYGWIFGLGDGTVNVGLGMLNSSSAFGKTDYRALLKTWLDGTPEEWGLREENAIGGIGGAALPMGFNRTPHYADGLLLIGDSGGAVNPFNGEGIAYAMESAALAADSVLQALGRPEGISREAALHGYATAMTDHLGSYYRLGGVFSTLIGHPKIMQAATRLGLPRKHLMYLVLKLLAGLYDNRDGDWADRVVRGLTKIAPTV
ncbi:geranylgeranyl reductase family protein [Nakamurella flavida]|uniref:Geranylgeranyl reductase family protein n=1 Tax=Nakamurella flavida TaxID=363630 RepID=A0A938YLX5_9ACTN|nr:geranylgeranyl reductase family protein [Nakamurella flavida]MBM9475812.1 geranylgeranyl reductase family protein [Nakamurella flavida]MDP9777906.1 geranylgeranyl reductase family protein [Nakamurella flavida]